MAGEITVTLDKVKELRSAGILRRPPQRRPRQPQLRSRRARSSTATASLPSPRPPPSPRPSPSPRSATSSTSPPMTWNSNASPVRCYGWHGNVNGGATIVRSTRQRQHLHRRHHPQPRHPRRAISPRAQPHHLQPAGDLRQTHSARHPPDQSAHPALHRPHQHLPHATPSATSTSRRASTRSRRPVLRPQLRPGPEPAAGLRRRHRLDATQDPNRNSSMSKPTSTTKSSSSRHQAATSTSSAPPCPRPTAATCPVSSSSPKSANALPAWNNTRAYSANASVALALPLLKRLSLTVTFNRQLPQRPLARIQKEQLPVRDRSLLHLALNKGARPHPGSCRPALQVQLLEPAFRQVPDNEHDRPPLERHVQRIHLLIDGLRNRRRDLVHVGELL